MGADSATLTKCIYTDVTCSVQTVTSIWTASQNKRLEKDKVKRGVEPGLDRETTVTVNLNDTDYEIHPFISHSDLVMKYHIQASKAHRPPGEEDLADTDHACIPADASATERNTVGHRNLLGSRAFQEEKDLLDELLEQVLDMETRARRLLINQFDHGSKPRLLLQADKNLMDRAQKVLGKGGDDATTEKTKISGAVEPLSDLEEIQWVSRTGLLCWTASAEHLFLTSYGRTVCTDLHLRGF